MKASTVPAVPVGDRRMEWLDHAACRGADPELFFPATDTSAARAQVEAAKKVCRRCPVRGICLSWAVDSEQEAGIWGGTTEVERRRLRRRYGVQG
jgi:WhiB family transcriptional regulator, redox-sensing transcriptional regulator